MLRPARVFVPIAVAAALAPLVAAQPPSSGPPPGTFARVAGDTAAAGRDSLVKALLAKIAGRENAPAESVFQDIRVLRGVPAGRMLRIMDIAFGRSLGVGCAHCHAVGAWEKNDRKQKEVARAMWGMMRAINDTLLRRIPDLASERPGINCTTCHRGQVKPALDIGDR